MVEWSMPTAHCTPSRFRCPSADATTVAVRATLPVIAGAGASFAATGMLPRIVPRGVASPALAPRVSHPAMFLAGPSRLPPVPWGPGLRPPPHSHHPPVPWGPGLRPPPHSRLPVVPWGPGPAMPPPVLRHLVLRLCRPPVRGPVIRCQPVLRRCGAPAAVPRPGAICMFSS